MWDLDFLYLDGQEYSGIQASEVEMMVEPGNLVPRKLIILLAKCHGLSFTLILY